ncbi:Wzz/FepE/Etk N-terminal domain-containing protein [Thermopolyspora sp. NPDC052614]|uniref:Wzz/FepE/Etk N-terminal domain-containing protein n=1 Tax=Thermopolyspora sp. NPDC052614 TaxID=3155682 RepID=UPI00343ABA9A
MRGSPFILLFRGHRLVTGVLMLAGALGGAAVYAVMPDKYTATAQVLVTATGVQDQPNQLGPRQRESLNLDTEAQIAQSAVVTGRAAEKLGTRDIEEIRRHVTITVPPNSAILSISFTDATPTAAAAGAQAFATAYLANREATAAQALAAQQRLLAAALRDADKDLDVVTSSLPTLTKGSAEHLDATQRHGILDRQVAALTARADALKTTAITPGVVISPARPPEAPSGPGLPLFVGSGLFLGLLAASATAVLREGRSRATHAW